ncbi:MAG: hypothetical protein ACXVCP_16140 [Bdellovibrio sp.]
MSYKRVVSAESYFSGDNLDSTLIGIGFKIGGQKEANPNIEDTLIAAAIEGMSGDFRILSLLTDWFEIHYQRVNADRLMRALNELKDQRVKAYFSAIGVFLKKDMRFKKFKTLYKGPRMALGLSENYDFLVKRNGEDERFCESKLLVAKGSLRRRLQDILEPEELAKEHEDYYYRVLIGPTYRADMISLIKRLPNLKASDLARKTYGSFATAWEVMRDMAVLRNVKL